MTCGGPIDFISVEDFIDLLCEKSKENISDKIADVEILGLENDGNPPVINKVFIDYSQNGGAFLGYSDDCDSFSVESHWKSEKIKLAAVSGNYKEQLAKQLEKLIYFHQEKKEGKTTLDTIAMIADQLAIRCIENFGNASHMIDFGNDKYAVVAIEDMKIESCVYNKQVRAGIIINKVTAFGTEVKEMK